MKALRFIGGMLVGVAIIGSFALALRWHMVTTIDRVFHECSVKYRNPANYSIRTNGSAFEVVGPSGKLMATDHALTYAEAEEYIRLCVALAPNW